MTASNKFTIFPIPASIKDKPKVQALRQANKGRFPVINDAYLEALNRKERYQIFYGGAGAGKSDAKATDLLIKCLIEPNFLCFYSRKIFSDIRDSQFKLFKDIINREGWQDFFHITETTMVISAKHAPENRLKPKGLLDVHQWTSIHGVTDIWIEEPLSKSSRGGGHVTMADFEELDRRLRGLNYRQHIHMTFNPISTHTWIYKDFFDYSETANGKAQTYEADAFKLKTTFQDNQFIDQAAEQAKFMRQGQYEFRIYGLGEWGVPRAASAFFYEFDMAKHTGEVDWNPNKPLYFCFDFNLDIMSCSVWQLDVMKKVVYCIDEFEPVRGIPERLDSIKTSRYFPHRNRMVVTGDASAPRDAFRANQTYYTAIKQGLALGTHQMKVAKRNMEHTDSRLLCNWIIRNWDFCIDPRCVQMLADLQGTETTADGRIDKKAHDPHFADTMRYLFQNILYKDLKHIL